MQTQPSPRPTHNYTFFYNECARFPQLPKFRSFGGQWTKKLYDDCEELLKLEEGLNDAIAEFRTKESGAPLTFLACPRDLVKKDKNLYNRWMEHDRKLRTYVQDLCLGHQLFQLPDHVTFFSKHLNKHGNLFPNGGFGPTDESGAAAAYQDPAARDFVALKGIETSDFLSKIWINHVDWIEKHVLGRLRNFFHRQQAQQGTSLTTVQLDTIIATMDALTCIFVPALLTGTMFALALIHPLLVRIAVVGCFGLAFAVSARLISGGISRGEIFAYTAAFFAVASVFVSTTDDDVSKLS